MKTRWHVREKWLVKGWQLRHLYDCEVTPEQAAEQIFNLKKKGLIQ